ncbi:MAG TPA: cyanophycinase [Candidatus Sulfopaludibacter sp.]|jgi:cyanophycinase-like exopeptidase|nr:cyanophycinase [Candidatus Sulfopaludibacter sp.]
MPRGALFLLSVTLFAQEAGYQSFHAGRTEPAEGHPTSGFLLAGGGNTTDEAYRWFARKAGGGDAVTVRASGADAMNKVLLEGGGLNSALTFLFKDRSASSDPRVVERLRKASVIWIAGGDQWNYIRFWKGTPVANAINERIRQGVPVGGSSAGLAVLGEFSFSAEHDGITSKQALANPFDPAVAITTDFLQIPLLKGILTDTHWVKRDRMGRTLVFLARLVADGKVRPASSIAVDEGNAVLLEPDGSARVSGPGAAYFLRTTQPPSVCEAGKPLSMAGIDVYRVTSAGHFDVKTWRGDGGTAYRLSVDAGVVHSTQAGGALY